MIAAMDFEARWQSARTALLVVDVQNDFCHADGKLGQRPGFDRRGLDETLQRIDMLAAEARLRRIPVIWVQAIYDRKYLAGPALLRRQGRDEDSDLCLEGSWGAELTLKAASEDRVLVKHRYSAFHATGLDALLRELGRDSVVVCGVTTNTCVMASALDASFHGSFPIIPSDCVWSGAIDAHALILREAARLYADVLPSGALLEHWGGTGAW